MTGNLQRVVAVSFGLLCILQALLNICLRLNIYEATDETDGCNKTTEERNILNKLDPYFQQGWFHFQSSLYYISPEPKTWSLSRDFCRQRGADLTTIDSQAEQDFVGRFKRAVWIGLSDPGSDGGWRWVDGSPLTQSYWLPNEPNNNGGRKEDCAELVNKDPKNGWNDIECNSINFFLCEKMII